LDSKTRQEVETADAADQFVAVLKRVRPLAQEGDVEALRWLARYTALGLGTEMDVEAATELYQRAVNAGDGETAYELGKLYRIQYAEGEEKNQWLFDKSVEAFQFAASKDKLTESSSAEGN